MSVEGNTKTFSQARGDRRTLFKLIAIGGATLVGFVAIVALLIKQERLVISTGPFSVRWQTPPRYVVEVGAEDTGHRYLFDDTLGWKNIPDFTATTMGKPLRINSKGLRDREYPYEKPAGTRRILVLGDSMTWGLGVGDDELFTEVLEKRLETEQPRWEVINAAVSGYGTDQEFLFLRQEGFKYQPDIVMVLFYLVNDREDNVSTIRYGLGKPCFARGTVDALVPPRYNPGQRQQVVRELNPMRISVTLLAEIDRLCRQNNARMVLVTCGIFGLPHQHLSMFNRTFRDEMEGRLSQVLGDSDWVSFDADAALMVSGVTPKQIFEGNVDVHWNAFGHKTVGDLLYTHLMPELRKGR